MAKSFDDIVDNQLNQAKKQFKSDILSGLDPEQWPDRIDYVAHRVANGEYMVGIQSNNPIAIEDESTFDSAVHDHYLRGISHLADNVWYQTALPKNFRLGSLLVHFAEMIDGMEDVGYDTLDSGEVLIRLATKNLKRNASGDDAELAENLSMDIQTPRGLVTELCSVPEVANLVESALPNQNHNQSFTDQLANVDLTTQLWDHQFEALVNWIDRGHNGYVNMATATGKTVLGLAAVAHCIDAGSLHPSDQTRLEEVTNNSTEPLRASSRSKDVLIVTTDELLGVQWARLFQTHCHTPPEFTQIRNGSIHLPWGKIDIRSAGGLENVDPAEYQLAIFDEVHNYTKSSGWGSGLRKFIESTCPVLALTGSETDELIKLAQHVDAEFKKVFTYKHERAIAEGIIPDFDWNLLFSEVDQTSTLSSLERTTTLAKGVVDFNSEGMKVRERDLYRRFDDLSEKDAVAIAGEYETGAQLANSIRETGSEDGVGPTPNLESLASGLSNRSIHRLNLSIDYSVVTELAEKALEQERPVLILTQSYQQAKDIWQALYDRNSERVVKRIEQDASPAKQDRTIIDFDEADTKQKVLIGPGKHIGQGNDIKSVEVGINISRSGSGVNATLIQRLGRLLRDAKSKDKVDFFHVTGVQPASSVIEPDGESFIHNAAEFFAQVITPDTDGIHKLPGVRIENETVGSDIRALEAAGAAHILAREQQTAIETAYATAINEQQGDETAVISTDWFVDTFPDAIQPTAPGMDGDEGESTETIEEVTVTVDPVIHAIAQMRIQNDDAYESLEDLVDNALGAFLDAVANADHRHIVEAFDITTDHTLSLSCDPILELAIETKMHHIDGLDSTDDYVRHAITEWLGIDHYENSIHLSNYTQHAVRVKKLLDREDLPCTTHDEVVQAALEIHFQQ